MKKNIWFQNRKPRWDLEKLHAHEKYLVNLNVKIRMWNCNGTISKHVCEIL